MYIRRSVYVLCPGVVIVKNVNANLENCIVTLEKLQAKTEQYTTKGTIQNNQEFRGKYLTNIISIDMRKNLDIIIDPAASETFMPLVSFMPTGLLRLADVFRGYRKRPMVWNGLMQVIENK